MLSRRAGWMLATACALLAAGCGIEDPYAERPSAEGRAKAAPPPPARAPATSSSPKTVLTRAALRSGNWTSKTLDDAFEGAITLSTGPARADLRRWAAEMRAGVAQTDVQLRSRATVEAVVLRGSGERRRALVVTREGITGGGLPGEGYEYKVTLATVEREGAVWVISRWAPQP